MLALRRTAKVVRFRVSAIVSVLLALRTSSRSSLSRSGVQDRRGVPVISLRLQPICNCFSRIFLKITCRCSARERTAVSVRFIRIPIAVELSPVSANLRSLSSSACVHGREAKWAGSVIGPCAPRVNRSCTDHFMLESTRRTRESRPSGFGDSAIARLPATA